MDKHDQRNTNWLTIVGLLQIAAMSYDRFVTPVHSHAAIWGIILGHPGRYIGPALTLLLLLVLALFTSARRISGIAIYVSLLLNAVQAAMIMIEDFGRLSLDTLIKYGLFFDISYKAGVIGIPVLAILLLILWSVKEQAEEKRQKANAMAASAEVSASAAANEGDTTGPT